VNELGRLHSNGDVKSMGLSTASGDEKASFIPAIQMMMILKEIGSTFERE
jgi:hypothetical protein